MSGGKSIVVVGTGGTPGGSEGTLSLNSEKTQKGQNGVCDLILVDMQRVILHYLVCVSPFL